LSKIIGESSGGILYALSLSVKLFLNIQSNGRTIIKEKKIKIIWLKIYKIFFFIN